MSDSEFRIPNSALPSSPVRFDRAVFTSATRAASEGYRILAASASLTGDERRVIQRTCPSHGGLCDDALDTCAVACFPLPSDRLCLVHSTHVGMEQTGRGGRRVYSHVLVATPDDFARFGNNPFHVLRLADRTGALEADLDAAGTLDPLDLAATDDDDARNRLLAGLEQHDPARLAVGLARYIKGASTILLADTQRESLLEILLLATPAPLRLLVSFSTGLTYSRTRAIRFNLLTKAGAPPPRLLRGSRIEVLDFAADALAASASVGRWPAVAETLWRDRAVDDLLAVTGLTQLDSSDAGLDRLADITHEAHAAATAGCNDLITLCTQRAAAPPQTAAESDVAARFWHRASARLAERWPVPQDDAARTDLAVLAELPRRDHAVADRLGPAITAILTRIADADPLNAFARAFTFAEQPTNPWRDALTTAEPNLFAALEGWAQHAADPTRPERALAIAHEWLATHPDSAAATETLTHLQPAPQPT